MNTIKAIETRYAGCHFRSRLEARWAVFFDHLGIAWQYEEQGYTVTNRLYLDGLPDSWNYLPDFWLPDLGVWAEVKGELDASAYRRLLSAAASLSSNDGSGCHDNGGHDIALFGPVPRPGGRTALPASLHMHKGDLYATPARFNATPGPMCPLGDRRTLIASDSNEIHTDASALLRGFGATVTEATQNAYTAARSARFEYGARGR